MPLWLTESDVRAVLSLDRLIDVMESALAAFSAGEVVQPVRTVFELCDNRSFFGLMPAFDQGHGILGAKLVSVIPANTGRNLPTHLASISLFSPQTGELLAVVDGRYITEVRTAAVSAISVRHLARAKAGVLAILGSGVQARSHLEAFLLVREFSEVRAWSPTADHLHAFAAGAPVPVRAARSAEEAVRGADVILLATSSPTPAIESDWVDAGAHVISIGACRYTQREMDPALVARSSLIVDSRAAALVESGDIVQGIREGFFQPDHIRAELGEVVSGKPGRGSEDEITLFKSLGLAIEDLVAADLAWRAGKQAGRGLQVSL
jgi:ornithine cyclodeaminase/alanine dehydrogenase-like protein (mu-crystallin family)